MFCPTFGYAQTIAEAYASEDWSTDLVVSGDYFVILESNPRVFKKIDGAWVFRQELLPESDADREPNGRFGGAIDIQDNIIVVNATNAVYVYEKQSDVWLNTHRFEVPESFLGDYPIMSRNALDVVISGDQIVAATGFGNQYYGGGALTFYKRTGFSGLFNGTEVWEFESTFFSRGGGFGKEMELSDKHLIISTQGLGEVFTYRKTDDTWTEGARLPLTFYPWRVPLHLENETLYYIDSSGEKLLVYDMAGVEPSLLASVPVAFDVLDENRSFPRDVLKVGDYVFMAYQRQVIVYELNEGIPQFSYRIRDPAGITATCCELMASTDQVLLLRGGARVYEFKHSTVNLAPIPLSPADNAVNQFRDGITLNWSSIPDALSYDLQLWSYDFQGERLQVSLSISNTSAIVALPEYDAFYSWWVRSVTAKGQSNWSQVFSFNTEPQPSTFTAWEPRFGAFGADSTITALATTWQGRLYAGGSFQNLGIEPIPYVAQWTGSQWLPLGEGVNGPVHQIKANFRTSDLYVLGDFDEAGEVNVPGLARWRVQRNVWDNPVPEFEGIPTHLSWDGNIGTEGGFYLATYDQSKASPGRLYQFLASSGFDDPLTLNRSWTFADSISAIDALDGEVMIGFDHPASNYGNPAECQFYGCVALLEGNSVMPLDSMLPVDSLKGVDHVAIAFRDYYIAGDFEFRVPDGPINYLAKYDGNDWRPIPANLNGPVSLLETACNGNCERFAVSQQLLYVGSEAVPHIGLWNNNEFLIPDGGTNGPVLSAVENYVAGNFTEAGGVASRNIGLWRGELPVNVEEEETAIVQSPATIYPNPARQQANILFALEQQTHVELIVFDALGREVMSVKEEMLLPGEHSRQIDVSHLAAGTYFVVLQHGHSRDTVPFVVQP